MVCQVHHNLIIDIQNRLQGKGPAYVGDSSTEDERSKNMGQLGAAMGVGIMLGPLFGGILAGYSLALPFFTGAGISFIAFLLIVTVLPESIERSGYPHKKILLIF